MSQSSPIAQYASNPLTDNGPLQQRFWHYLLNHPAPNSATEAPAAVGGSRLAIDRQAAQRRDQLKQQQQAQLASYQQRFIEHFEKDLSDTLGQLHLSEQCPIKAPHLALLNEIINPNISRSKAMLLLQGQPLLGQSLLRYVNRQLQQRGNALVTNPKLAFTYLGVQQIQQALPWLQFQLWHRSSKINLRQRKLWRMVQQQKRLAGQLAHHYGLDVGISEACAVLQAVDALLLLHCAEVRFNELQQLWLKRAREAREKQIHQAVLTAQLPSQSLLKLWQQPHLWGYRCMAGQLHDGNKRLLAEMAQRDYQQLSPITAVVAQAHLMTISRTLKKRKLIEREELEQWLSHYPKPHSLQQPPST